MPEERLRHLFQALAECTPAVDDPAGRAIGRARALRRRRAAGSGVAVALALVLTLSGALTLRGRMGIDGGVGSHAPLSLPPPEAASASPDPTVSVLAGRALPPDARLAPTPIGLDLRVGDELWSAAGPRLPLAGVGDVTRVYRVPLGWVYGGTGQVRLLRPDGTSVLLSSPGEGWLVSPDGSRLAYVAERRLRVHKIVKKGLAKGTAVPVPEGVRPVTFAGEHVIISAGESGPLDSLDPVGGYRQTWSDAVVSVYGAAGKRVAGLVHGERADTLCLASLTAGRQGLAVGREGRCRSAAGVDKAGVLAPDGRWLAEPGDNEVALVDVERTLAGDSTVLSCPVAEPAGLAWADAETLLVAKGRGAVRCRTDGVVQPVDLPAGITEDWALVPNLAPGTQGPSPALSASGS